MGRQIDDRERVAAELNQDLGPEYISYLTGHPYLEGHRAVQLANEIFGFDGWSTSVIKNEVDFCDMVGNTGRCNVGIYATVRVTLASGTYHEDIGYGSMVNAPSKLMAFDKARKEAHTDAMKRALRHFGPALGNCLNDKNYAAKVRGTNAQKVAFDPEDLRRPKPRKRAADPSRPAVEATSTISKGPEVKEGKPLSPKRAKLDSGIPMETPTRQQPGYQSGQPAQNPQQPEHPKVQQIPQQKAQNSGNQAIKTPATSLAKPGVIVAVDTPRPIQGHSYPHTLPQVDLSSDDDGFGPAQREFNRSDINGSEDGPASFVTGDNAELYQRPEAPQELPKESQFDPHYRSPAHRTLPQNHSSKVTVQGAVATPTPPLQGVSTNTQFRPPLKR